MNEATGAGRAAGLRWKDCNETEEVWPDDADDDSKAGLSDEAINALGAEGWELVAALPFQQELVAGGSAPTLWIHCVFNRPKPDKSGRSMAW